MHAQWNHRLNINALLNFIVHFTDSCISGEKWDIAMLVLLRFLTLSNVACNTVICSNQVSDGLPICISKFWWSFFFCQRCCTRAWSEYVNWKKFKGLWTVFSGKKSDTAKLVLRFLTLWNIVIADRSVICFNQLTTYRYVWVYFLVSSFSSDMMNTRARIEYMNETSFICLWTAFFIVWS